MKQFKIAYNMHEIFFAAFIALVAMTLVGCGGSGGGDASNDTNASPATTSSTDDGGQTATTSQEPAPTYEPEAEKLDETAETSSDLYVEPEFQFDTYKSLVLDVIVTDYEGAPMANTIVFVSAIAPGITELDSPELNNKSLITVLKTDAAGAVYRKLEVSQNLTNLLFEVNGIGVENEHIMDITDLSEVHVQL